MRKILLLLIIIPMFTLSINMQAAELIAKNQVTTQTETDKEVSAILQNLKHNQFANFAAKVAYINHLFIGKPYLFNALGEGQNAEFDNYPLYRTDVFDCETYVDTIIAFALAKDLTTFKQLIKKIRYKNGKVSFINRNHFTCLDWNFNNQQQGITQDITASIKDKDNNNIAVLAETYIDKPNWYKNMAITRIRQQTVDTKTNQEKLEKLRAQGQKLPKSLSKITYIPLAKIFYAEDKIDKHIISQIPNAAIIEIIRPNWNLCKIIGTNLNVSHLGFVIWEKDKPYFIHASSDKLMTVKTSLLEYLKVAKENPTIKGINIQVINQNFLCTGQKTTELKSRAPAHCH